jgi:hypothetical protein
LVCLFGAICPDRAVGAAIIMPAANTAAMNEHLKEISTQARLGAHAVLIRDGAGWQKRGPKLKFPANITLIRLPPYAPELNSMENVWHYLRANKLRMLVWDSYEAIVAACKAAWDFLTSDPDRIRSVGSQFARVTINPTICGADALRRDAYEKAAIAARDGCMIGRSRRGNIAVVVGGVSLPPSTE